MQYIYPKDIQQVKAQALASRAHKVAAVGGAAATTLGIYRMLSNAYHGNFEGAGSLLGESALGVGTAYGLSKLLDNPFTRKALTNVTPRDVAAIPPDLARDMGPILEQAKAKGIKVSPALTVAIAASSPNKWYNRQQ
jgi:post-segregation antitoxin (ccd killing protein)